MHPCFLNLCHDPHSPPPHPSPSLPPPNRSACPPSRSILTGTSQNRPEVRFCAETRPACALCDAKVGRWGHPPNFVGSSIRRKQKFGGWISQRWVPSWGVAGCCGGANVPRERKIARKCGPSVRIGRERVATVAKSRGGSSSKLCLSFCRRRTQVWRMDLQRWVRRSGVSGRRRRSGSQEFGRLRGAVWAAGQA